MMTKKENSAVETGGMTLRDYFAAHALTGMQQWDAIVNSGAKSVFIGEDGMKLMGRIAYTIADAMLAARKQGD